MKILAHGIKKPLVWEVTCKLNPNSLKGCGARLEVGVEDLTVTKIEEDDPRERYYLSFYSSVTCPDCGNEVKVEAIPGDLSQELYSNNTYKVKRR